MALTQGFGDRESQSRSVLVIVNAPERSQQKHNRGGFNESH
jgi:hypothetical protein